MRIDESKTKIMIFNLTKSLQFPPEVGFNGDQNLEVVRKAKILGIVISVDLKWSEKTDSIISNAKSRLWTLRTMKRLGISIDVIFEV